ncbi:DNA/RNA non-specific endonuclease [Butyrivibrio sp. FCS014]|uniref:DNA/RNA non-specific endonuclease n=1 Tax=Butyrivibrio sp. FCS014 TaxID=1408304 RepID=UPI000464EC22|nr:DNA/RNA non-specific endonuclease [Butyrivibrio sp. FCS014]
MRRFWALSLAVILMVVCTSTVYACDENQCNNHVTEILFGDEAASYNANDKVKMLLNALYLCCEQSDNQGQEKIDFLKLTKVSRVPDISDININSNALNDCSHISWEYDYAANKKIRSNRKRILQNTVNKVFDFGALNNLFGSESGKCNSFAAFLYYSHILSDYLSDDPDDTEVNIKGKSVDAFSGQAYVSLNGNKPQFSVAQKTGTEEILQLNELDSLRRCVGACATIGKESMNFIGARPNLPDPTGWKNKRYPDLVSAGDVYNRCHVIARRFCGIDNLHNLITGTRYLNDTMGIFEDRVANYIEETSNHVVYRVTPIYKGDNLIASGVQMEAFSVEDAGKGVCFNVYCYNVQPGIDIDYASGNSEQADKIFGSQTAIPFVVSNPNDSNPDLIYEINKHLEILFEQQKSSSNYNTMIGEINSIANEARSLGSLNDKPAQTYSKMKTCEYKYYEILKRYIPILLRNEDFFKSAFG